MLGCTWAHPSSRHTLVAAMLLLFWQNLSGKWWISMMMMLSFLWPKKKILKAKTRRRVTGIYPSKVLNSENWELCVTRTLVIGLLPTAMIPSLFECVIDFIPRDCKGRIQLGLKTSAYFPPLGYWKLAIITSSLCSEMNQIKYSPILENRLISSYNNWFSKISFYLLRNRFHFQREERLSFLGCPLRQM